MPAPVALLDHARIQRAMDTLTRDAPLSRRQHDGQQKQVSALPHRHRHLLPKRQARVAARPRLPRQVDGHVLRLHHLLERARHL